MPTVKRFSTPLGTQPPGRMRVHFTTDAGTVMAFVVQLEVFDGTAWVPVIRYDGVHGFAHCDRHRRDGEQRKELLNLSYADALTYAAGDVKTHWRTYAERFLRGEYP